MGKPNENGKLTLVLMISLLFVLICLFAYTIYIQHQYHSEVLELRSAFKEMAVSKNYYMDLNKFNEYFDEYILNQKHLDSNWYNTIINQSGLSIIVTIIIILISFSISIFTQNQIENRIMEESKRLEDRITAIQSSQKEYTDTISSDITTLVQFHFSPNLSGSMIPYGNSLFEKKLDALNSFNRMKIITRHSVYELYINDLQEFAKPLFDELVQPLIRVLYDYQKERITEGTSSGLIHFKGEFDINPLKNQFNSKMQLIQDPNDRKNMVKYVIDHFDHWRRTTDSMHISEDLKNVFMKILEYVEETYS